jgi:hypothetical protein
MKQVLKMTIVLINKRKVKKVSALIPIIINRITNLNLLSIVKLNLKIYRTFSMINNNLK